MELENKVKNVIRSSKYTFSCNAIWKYLFVIQAKSFLMAFLVFKELCRYWLISEQTCKVDVLIKYDLCFRGWEIETKKLNWPLWEPGCALWPQTSWSYLCQINKLLFHFMLLTSLASISFELMDDPVGHELSINLLTDWLRLAQTKLLKLPEPSCIVPFLFTRRRSVEEYICNQTETDGFHLDWHLTPLSASTFFTGYKIKSL